MDDFLDDIFISQILEPSTGFTTAADYVGVNNRVTVNMRFRVDCSTNYFGNDCNTFCVAMNNDVNGHYICNSDGSIQCLAGFEQPENNCTDSEPTIHSLSFLF